MKNTLTALTVGLAACGLAQAQDVTLSFQQGLNGYTGTQDTEIRSIDPSGNYGEAESISVDGDDGSPGLQPNHGLIRFGGLFGTGTGQIQPGDTITSATLTLNVFNPGSGWRVHDMLTDWAESSATWDSFGAGVQPDGVEAAATPVLSIGADDFNENIPVGLLVMDLTASLQAWQAGSLAGYGWALLPFTNGGNGIDFDTSESFSPSARPLLQVTVTPVPEPGTVALLLAGLATIGWAASRRRG